MKKQIRDIELIEKELNKNHIGILALIVERDSINQLPVRYLYSDKNVYIFFREDDEQLSKIQFGAELSFTVLKTFRIKDTVEDKINSTSIIIAGSAKFVEDQKVIDELKKIYDKKYKISTDQKLKVIMIDTQEFQAFNHTEG